MGNMYIKEDDVFSVSQNGVVPKPTQADITANKVLGADGTWKTSGGGGASSLSGLDDTNISSPTNGQVLKYNATSSKWENANESSGGIMELKVYDYVHFDGNVKLELPYTINADYEITVDFETDSYIPTLSVIGNTTGAAYSHLTYYNNKYYCSAGSSEANFTAELLNRHVFSTNNGNANKFDGATVTNYSPYTGSGIRYTIGYRQDVNQGFQGKYYGYQIKRISTGDLICNLIPAKYQTRDGIVILYQGFYDTINKTFYYQSGMTLGND